MGTNYYLHTEKRDRCGLANTEPTLHIGKSPSGWCFSLRIHPDRDIRDLWDWVPLFFEPSNVILDEYGNEVPPAEMLRTITERSFSGSLRGKLKDPVDCEEGPNGLVRHRVGNGVCVGHGVGPWDLMRGDFC